MANIGYALDELGTNPANKVTERRILTSKVIDGRCFMIPKVTPFFGDPAKITVKFGNSTLIRDIDYQLILHSPELSERLNTDIYAGILFHKLEVNQIVDVEIQTPGGDFNLPLGHTAENLARIIKNPVYTTFSQIIGTPAGLPTFSHIQDWSSINDFNDLVKEMQLIYLALLSKGGGGSGGGNDSAFLQALQQHITGASAHTKEQVGLGNLFNYPLSQYSDFVGPTYPNNRYVTPRSVMYAINLFIGNQINEVNQKIAELEQTTQGAQQDWNLLKQQWSDLQVTLNSVSNNYQQMLRQVQGYEQAVQNIDQTLKTIQGNQQEWNNKLTELNQTVLDYSDDYQAVIDAKDQMVQQMATLQVAYENFLQQNKTVVENLQTVTLRVGALEKHVMYPGTKTITAGSYNFRIKPGEKYNITLIGAGGGVGEYLTDPPSIAAIQNGEHGTSSSFWCLQALDNAEYTPDNKAIVVAGGGFGGCSSYGDANGVVSQFGIGGRGGNFEIQESLVTILEASAGEGGFKGFGNYNAQNISIQETGYEYFGKWWGRGATTATAVGQGGEGAQVKFTYENKTTKELDFMVVVGARGRSYNPAKNGSTGGLAIITKL